MKLDAHVMDVRLTRRDMLLGLAAAACVRPPEALAMPASATTGTPATPAAPAAAWVVEGVALPDTVMAHGRRLVLNGAGLRKRGYYKSNVVAMYLPDRLTTVDAVMRLDGPRRIQLHLLRDFSTSTISRIFLSDFKQAATDAEFKQLINEVAEIGAIYSSIRRVENGDVVNIDWVPGKGIVTLYNDQAIGNKPINNELAYQIYLRMFLGKGVPDALRNALLGLVRPTA